jgi:hypothetical protein
VSESRGYLDNFSGGVVLEEWFESSVKGRKISRRGSRNPVAAIAIVLMVATAGFIAAKTQLNRVSAGPVTCDVVAHDVSASANVKLFRDLLRDQLLAKVEVWKRESKNWIILFPISDERSRDGILAAADKRGLSIDDPSATKKAKIAKYVSALLREAAKQRTEPAPERTEVLRSLSALGEQLNQSESGGTTRSCQYRLITTGSDPASELDPALCAKAFGIYGGRPNISFVGLGRDPDATANTGFTKEQSSKLAASWEKCATYGRTS